jgi:hypothetical protein
VRGGSSRVSFGQPRRSLSPAERIHGRIRVQPGWQKLGEYGKLDYGEVKEEESDIAGA